LGSSLPATQFPVSRSALRSFVPTAVQPFTLLRMIHPSTGFAPSSSPFCPGRRRPLRRRCLPWGLPPSLLATPTLKSVLFMSRLPHPNNFTSSAFLTLSTFCAFPSLADLFHSAATSRVSLQGFFPLTQEMKLSLHLCPLVGFSKLACKQLPTCSSYLRAALKASLRVRIRTYPTTAINRNWRPFPSWFSLLQVFSRSRVKLPSQFLPPYVLHRICHSHLRCRPLATAGAIGLSFPRPPTCSRFSTCR
jgi:hypothetical protein